jgi:hypothetical protein
VERARASEALSVIKTLAEAEERYYMATGKYTPTAEDLDVTIPKTKHFDIILDYTAYNIRAYRGGDASKYHFRYFMQKVSSDSYPGRLLCLVPVNDPSYSYVCEALGGKDPHVYKYMETTQTAYYLK